MEARQAKREEKQAAGGSGSKGGGAAGSAPGSQRGSGRNTPAPEDGRRGGKQWEDAPEVRMAPAIREMVEGTVKKVSRFSVRS